MYLKRGFVVPQNERDDHAALLRMLAQLETDAKAFLEAAGKFSESESDSPAQRELTARTLPTAAHAACASSGARCAT